MRVCRTAACGQSSAADHRERHMRIFGGLVLLVVMLGWSTWFVICNVYEFAPALDPLALLSGWLLALFGWVFAWRGGRQARRGGGAVCAGGLQWLVPAVDSPRRGRRYRAAGAGHRRCWNPGPGAAYPAGCSQGVRGAGRAPREYCCSNTREPCPPSGYECPAQEGQHRRSALTVRARIACRGAADRDVGAGVMTERGGLV